MANNMSDGIGIKIAIEPETINKYVSEAVLNSVLGEKLKKEINTKLESLLNGGIYGRGIVGDVVEEQMREAIRTVLLGDDFQSKIKDAVSRYMTEKFTQQFIAKSLDVIWDKLLR